MSTPSARPADQAGSRQQVARLLTLVPYLHARASVRLDEAAAALEVTPTTLLKDLKILFMCGLPGGYPDDLIDVDLDAIQSEDGRIRTDGVVRVSNADYLDRPLRMTPVEASAIIVALRALRDGAEPDTVAIVDRALMKLERAAASGPVQPSPLHAAPTDPGSTTEVGGVRPARAELAELAHRLTDAADRQRQVELDYYVASRDELSHRVVDPRGVVERDGLTYLDAWCHSAEASRLFRLDRVAEAVVLDEPVVTEPAAPRDLAEGIFTPSDDLARVTLRLRPAARWVVEYYPVEEVRLADPGAGFAEGTVDVDLVVADERWLTKLLLRLAPNASVVEPSGAAARLTAQAQQALALYDLPTT